MGLDRMNHSKATRFSLSKITTSYCSSEWDMPPLSKDSKKEFDDILNQKFTYLGKGSQVYVFISEDQKYVIKFFKQNKLYPLTWLAYIPFSPYYPQSLKLKEKRQKTFHAAKVAFTQCQQETQIAYVHLNRTNDLKKQLIVIDKRGKSHMVPLDKVSFYIQKKADLLYPRIAELMKQKNIEGAKKVVDSLFILLERLGQKGVVGNDPILRKNFGLMNDEAIQLDIGRMYIDPRQPLVYKSQIVSISTHLSNWIKSEHPELHPYFEACQKSACL